MKTQSTRNAAAASAVAAFFLLASCQQFFTASIAKPLARTSYNLGSVTLDGALSMLDTALASGDAAAADALVGPLAAAMAAATTPEAYDQAATALVSAAVLSSGVGPAMTTIATLFLSSGDSDDPTALLSGAVAALSTVSLSADARDALLLVAADPPAGMSADDAYASAVALVADAFSSADADLSDLESLDETQQAALLESPSLGAALLLIEHAQATGGDESLFGSLLSGFDLSAFGS